MLNNMVKLAEQKKQIADIGERFLKSAQLIVNGSENLADQTWFEFETALDKRTQKANMALKILIARLPSHTDEKLGLQGFVDFNSAQGQRRQIQFMRDVAKVYGSWQRGILGDLDIKRWAPGEPAWEKSLGLHDHTGGLFLLKLRDEVVRKGHQIASLLDLADEKPEELDLSGLSVIESINAILEAKHRRIITTGGVLSARLTGRGLPQSSTAHSRRTSIILRGLKGIISDQEKAMLENTLRGLDELPTKHANKLYDAATGLTLKSALNAVADEFSTGQMNKRQLKLSIQTHIRAMLRRIAGEAFQQHGETGVAEFIRIPPNRKKDRVKKITPETQKLAFTLDTGKELIRKTKGAGDSLGRHPGDKFIPMPVPTSLMWQIKRAAEKARREFLEKQGKA
jgi:hypothetical protein